MPRLSIQYKVKEKVYWIYSYLQMLMPRGLNEDRNWVTDVERIWDIAISIFWPGCYETVNSVQLSLYY